MNTLIRNATILTMDGADRVVERGAVAVSQGAISYVGAEQGIPAGFVAQDTVDARGGTDLKYESCCEKLGEAVSKSL